MEAENTAKATKRGIWAGAFTTPSDWRRGERARGMGFAAPGGPDGPIPAPAERAETPDPGSYAIRGNISRAGEKIYHVPGSRDYNRTRMSLRLDQSSVEELNLALLFEEFWWEGRPTGKASNHAGLLDAPSLGCWAVSA